MKRMRLFLCGIGFIFLLLPCRVRAQEYEIQQLLLDVEKLAQLKGILQQMYSGYEIISKGYSAIKNISEGNFNLHDVFLQGLLAVSPSVQKYKRVADIIDYQVKIVKEYQAAFQHFREDKNFTPAEVVYMGKVYKNLFDQSLSALDELFMVTTAGKLRMSDDERIKAIDGIFSEVEDQLLFLRYFNSNTSLLALQRAKEKQEVDLSRIIHGIK